MHYGALDRTGTERICDITAGQFADECDEPIPDVTVITAGSPESFRYEPLAVDPDDIDLDPDDIAWVAQRTR